MLLFIKINKENLLAQKSFKESSVGGNNETNLSKSDRRSNG